MVEVLVGIGIGLLVGGVVFVVLKKQLLGSTKDTEEAVTQAVEMKIKTIMPEVLRQTNESLITMANEKLGSEKKEIKTDMENKRGEIERMIKVIQQDLKTSEEKLNKAEKERVGSYQALRKSLEQQEKVVTELSVNTDNLKKLLSNNQQRGAFGEQVADDLLQMVGFVPGIDYEFNKKQEGSGTRPDFSVFLPDKTRINIDVKFPFSNLQKLAEAENDEEKKKYHALFVQDVKEKIKQVSTRDYINPEDKTVDFVILFIPNEMIFSYIYEKMPEVWQEAMSKKVVLAGPFTFTAVLRMVKQSYDNFRIQENIHEVIKYVKDFSKEFDKFGEEFSVLGTHIQRIESKYDEISTTRMNQLGRKMDKVQMISDTDQVEIGNEGSRGQLTL